MCVCVVCRSWCACVCVLSVGCVCFCAGVCACACMCACMYVSVSRLDCFSHEGSFCVSDLAALIHTGLARGWWRGVAPFAGCCKVVGGTGCVERETDYRLMATNLVSDYCEGSS